MSNLLLDDPSTLSPYFIEVICLFREDIIIFSLNIDGAIEESKLLKFIDSSPAGNADDSIPKLIMF